MFGRLLVIWQDGCGTSFVLSLELDSLSLPEANMTRDNAVVLYFFSENMCQYSSHFKRKCSFFTPLWISLKDVFRYSHSSTKLGGFRDSRGQILWVHPPIQGSGGWGVVLCWFFLWNWEKGCRLESCKNHTVRTPWFLLLYKWFNLRIIPGFFFFDQCIFQI